MARAIQTAVAAFGLDGVPPPGLRVFLQPLHSERWSAPCDQGSRKSTLADSFPIITNWGGFAELTENWTPTQQNDKDWMRRRVPAFREWLSAQPENRICVVGHGAFFQELCGKHLRNCEIAELLSLGVEEEATELIEVAQEAEGEAAAPRPRLADEAGAVLAATDVADVAGASRAARAPARAAAAAAAAGSHTAATVGERGRAVCGKESQGEESKAVLAPLTTANVNQLPQPPPAKRHVEQQSEGHSEASRACSLWSQVLLSAHAPMHSGARPHALPEPPALSAARNASPNERAPRHGTSATLRVRAPATHPSGEDACSRALAAVSSDAGWGAYRASASQRTCESTSLQKVLELGTRGRAPCMGTWPSSMAGRAAPTFGRPRLFGSDETAGVAGPPLSEGVAPLLEELLGVADGGGDPQATDDLGVD
eukprot:3253217-Prymnesium_polylepis.1